MDPPLPVNPYIAGKPVTGTEMFYGREDVFAFIRRNLIGKHQDNPIGLVGHPRTGKTSVLYQLHRHIDARYRCIFMDMHGLNLDGMSNLLHSMASSVSRSLRRDHQITVSVPDRAAFEADCRAAFEAMFLDQVWPALGTDHLVLMLDEVVQLDEEVRAGRLERDVFEFLRHLMQHHPRLNFIFSMGSGVEEMAKEYTFLFNASLSHRITFLEESAARELITQPVREHYRVSRAAVAKILQITSGHPYYTQLVCHGLFDLWSRSPKRTMGVKKVDAVLTEAIELGSANLAHVWQEADPAEKALMAGMAAARRGTTGPVTADQARDAWREIGVRLPERETTRAVHSLTVREVIAKASGQAYSFTVDLQRRWLDQHHQLNWVKDELEGPIQQWAEAADEPAVPPPPTRRRRYRVLAAATAIAVGIYLVTAATAHIWPWSGGAAGQDFLQLLPGGLNSGDCHTAPPARWTMFRRVPGAAVHRRGLGRRARLRLPAIQLVLPAGGVAELQSVVEIQSVQRWRGLPADRHARGLPGPDQQPFFRGGPPVDRVRPHAR